MTTATAAKDAAAMFTHVRVAPRKGYNVVDTQTQEVVAHHIGDGRSIHAGRTLAIRDAKARNEAAAEAATVEAAVVPTYRTYVSVLPNNAEATVRITALVLVLGMTYRHVGNSPVLYVFTSEADTAEALIAVRDVIGDLGATIEAGAAADGARRVTIDPRLLAD